MQNFVEGGGPKNLKIEEEVGGQSPFTPRSPMNIYIYIYISKDYTMEISMGCLQLQPSHICRTSMWMFLLLYYLPPDGGTSN